MRIAKEHVPIILTTMFLNVVIRTSTLPRNPILEIMAVNYENKLWYYESYMYKLGYDTMNC